MDMRLMMLAPQSLDNEESSRNNEFKTADVKCM